MLILGCGKGVRIMENQDMLKAGKLGEELTIKELKKLDFTFITLNGFRIFLGRKSLSAEIDHLVISKGGIFLIDSKHWSGEVEFTYPGLRRVKTNGEVEIISPQNDPTGQLEHHKYIFEQLLNQLGFYNVKTFGVLCFTTNNIKIKNDNPKYKALTLAELNDYILENSKEDLLTFEQMLQIKDYIEKNGKPSNTYDSVKRSSKQESIHHRNQSKSRPAKARNSSNTPKLNIFLLGIFALLTVFIFGSNMIKFFENSDIEDNVNGDEAVLINENVVAPENSIDSNQNGSSDLSHLEPYTTGDITFSDFSLSNTSEGYYLEMTITNTNDTNQISLGWVGDGAVTINTSEGKYSDGFPRMEILDPGMSGNYSFSFVGASGIPSELVINDIYVLRDGLPDKKAKNDYIIPLN